MVVHMTAERLAFTDLAPLARRVADDIVWCTMTTIGPDDRPRSRVVHPLWRWTEDDRGPVGFVTSRPTPLRRRHLAAHPVATMAYWSPSHDALFVDADVSWIGTTDAADVAERHAVWDLASSLPPPVGFDPAPMFPGGPDDDGFAPIRLLPYRIQVVLADRMAKGEPSYLWSATS